MQTVPTGFPGTAPPGPAMPLVARAMSHPRALRAPEAISLTTGMLTAPWASSDASLTSSRRRFTSLEYDTTPPSMAAELPGSAVIVWAMLPPVQLSAVPTVRWRSTSMSSRHRAGVMSPRHIRLPAASRASSSARRSISFFRNPASVWRPSIRSLTTPGLGRYARWA